MANDNQSHPEHAKPLIFGNEGEERGIRLKPGVIELEVVRLGEGGVGDEDLLVHDETNRSLAFMLAAMAPPDFPMALGVLYCDPAPSYETLVRDQIEEAKARTPNGDLNALLREGYTWTVG